MSSFTSNRKLPNDKNVDHQDAVVIDEDSTIRIWSLVFGTYITFVSCKGELRLYNDDQWKNSTILIDFGMGFGWSGQNLYREAGEPNSVEMHS